MKIAVRETVVVRVALEALWLSRFRQPLPRGLTNTDAWTTLSECGLDDEDLRAAVRAAFDPTLTTIRSPRPSRRTPR